MPCRKDFVLRYDPSITYSLRLAGALVLVGLIDSVAYPDRSRGAAQSSRPPALIGILEAELRRNVDVLKAQAVPAYYTAYTVNDTKTTQIFASFGAIDRSDESRQRFATVEVRVGDYQLDNTHPIRGDARAMSPRLLQVSLPLTDDEKPIRQALWRATDRSYKQASEALTRVKSNVAAKVQDENPAPDFSKEEQQHHVGATAPMRSKQRRGKRGCGGCRRCFRKIPSSSEARSH